jgi:cobalt-zinc-cadmium efflux system membrane fusion protein
VDITRQAGLDFAEVENRSVTQTLECNAETDYNGNRYARLSSRAAGVVREVLNDIGHSVAAGDALAVIDSSELATAKAESLQAAALVTLWDKNHARKHGLMEKGIVSEKDDLEAENKLTESQIALSRCKQRLKSLGLGDAQIADALANNDTRSMLTITAPFAGDIVERDAVIGELVDTSKTLFAVADTTTMWAMLDVYEADAHKIKVGQPVVFGVDGLPGESFGGKLTWVSTRIDPKTRTLKARAEVDNSHGLLKANMFGRAQVTIHDKETLLVVPKTAVQWDGCCNIAFVKLSDTLYEPRKLRLGCDAGDYYEVASGLADGEFVVTRGSYLLKTEVMKSSIGAGCCEPRGKKG